MFFRRYDDGDVDKNPKAKHVKAPTRGPIPTAAPGRRGATEPLARRPLAQPEPKPGADEKLREGDKVQAHFRGRARKALPGEGRQDHPTVPWT